MIVNYTAEGWSMIMQRSHGLLAAQICAQWKKEDQPARWVDTLIATAEHDDANEELSMPEINPETGGPKNFKMKPFDEEYCDRLLNMAFAKGRYVGLLIARHIRFLYRDEPTAGKYCEQLEQKEAEWITEAGTTEKAVAASYELLEFCDALSLIMCQDLIPPEGRKMEISNGPDGTTYQLFRAENGDLAVQPWPFEPASFEVSYESRCISQLSFKRPEALRDLLQQANARLHAFTFSKP
ncbi:DUF3891 family protein [Dyadobacter sandarakinus]|uniref:DUF3891 family protein n=1 Tax=Dyadobacter sandarakinus TaxID=2747268 RepID=A0ABX7I2V1_9BACT|nr:DUF3891 family protein [Dyadobacter sandarakinus]QRR00275.1 DUF3891 family protein [Dyadobacter sandarakinus]